MASTKRVMGKLKNPLLIVLIAAAMAGGVAWAAYYYLQQREAAMKAEITARGKASSVPRISVAVPNADVVAGTVLDQQSFVARPIEADLVYPDTVLEADFPSMEGLKLARPVLRGRPLRLSDLSAPEIRDVAAILPAGRRAMTIDIDNINSIAQALRPNHRIDIYLLSKAARRSADAAQEAAGEQDQASLYMQNMTVIATGAEFFDVRTGPDSPGAAAAARMERPGDVAGAEKSYDSVTLLVTPAQAARLMIGQKIGSFRVVLRGSGDATAIAMAPLRATDLLPGTPKARDSEIEFIVGGKGEQLVTQLPQGAARGANSVTFNLPPKLTSQSPPAPGK